MKNAWYEVVKVWLNRLFPTVIALAFIANAALFYHDLTSRYPGSMMFYNKAAYERLIAEYKNLPVDRAFEELKAKYEELQAYNELAMVAQNPFSETQEELDEQIHQIEEAQPGIVQKYNAEDYTLYTGDLVMDCALISDVFKRVGYLHDYPAYILSMTDRMNEMLSVSIFYREGTFAHRNIVKTPRDFAALRGIPLMLDLSEGVVQATEFAATDVFVILAVFLLCIYLVSIEKDRKLLLLVKSTRNGRGVTIACKLAVLAASAGALALVFYGANLFIGMNTLGFGDLDRTIQSIPEFRGCDAALTVGQYLRAFLLIKMLATVLISLAIFTVILLSFHSSYAYAALAAVFALEWTAWKFIGVTSFINHLKFINLFGFLDAFNLYANYQNLNLFGQPLGVRLLLYCVAPLCMALLAAVCSVAFTKRRPHESTGLLQRAADRCRLLFARLPGTASLFLHELHRLLIDQKALVLLILLLALQVYAVSNAFAGQSADRVIYGRYLLRVSGPLTEDTQAAVADEQAKFDNAPAIVAQAAEDYNSGRITVAEYNGFVNRNAVLQERATAFEWVAAQYDYLRSLETEKGIKAWFIDSAGFTQLFALNGYGNDLNNQLLLTAALIVCLSASFAQDNANRFRRIALSCREGRGRAVVCRYLSCCIITVAVAAIVYGAQLVSVAQRYELRWDAPVQSVMAFTNAGPAPITRFADCPLRVTVGEYAMMLYAVRLCGVLAMASVILLVSAASGNMFVSVFVSASLLEAPALLVLLGLDVARYFSFTAPLSANMLLEGGNPMPALNLAPPLCMGFAALTLTVARIAYAKKLALW